VGSYEVPLHDIVWSLGSICALHHRAFDADLVLRELPAPPLTTDTLITAGRSSQFRVQRRDVTRDLLAKLTMPCLGVLHDIAPPVAPQPVDLPSSAGGTGAPRARMALIVRVDETQESVAAGVPQLVSPWHVETFMAARAGGLILQ
jgi:hypothetical protein